MTSHPFPPGAHLAAYLRDSGGDEQDLSITQQETALRAWCAQNSCTLTRIFTDTRSATSTTGRAGFDSLINHFLNSHAPPETGILLWRYNRFARDLDDAQFFKAALRRRGITIHSLQDPIPEGPAGRILEFFVDWMADKYSTDLAIDIQRGLHHLITTHGAIGGRPPVGFIRQPLDLGPHRSGSAHIVHRWVPNPDLWETCRTAWIMRAAGATYTQIHNATHLLSSPNSYTTFFKNRIYLGELRYGPHILPNYCTPLIDEATWNAVQAISNKRTKSTNSGNPAHPRRQTSTYLLSGLIRCHHCGSLLTSQTVRPRHEPHTRAYYICPNRARWSCPTARIPQQQTEAAILQHLAQHILQPAQLHHILEQQRLLRLAGHPQLHAQRAELTKRLATLTRQTQNLTSAIAQAGHSTALLAALAQLETETTNLTNQRAEIDAQLTAAAPIDRATVEAFCATASAILTSAPHPAQRRILHGFIHAVTAQRSAHQVTLEIHYYIPPTLPTDPANCMPTPPLPPGTPPVRIQITLHRRRPPAAPCDSQTTA